MSFNFDEIIPRRGTDCEKWDEYPEDVLPLWVADMDFRAPPAVIEALRARVEHGIFGYGREPAGLREIITARLKRLYGWSVAPEALVFVPGVVRGIHMACRGVVSPGEAVMYQVPVYPPIHWAPAQNGLMGVANSLVPDAGGYYTMDFDAIEAQISRHPVRMFILCNPHNPVGRVFRRPELERLAEICLRHNVIICSDEIHCDLVYRGHPHIPIATLSPEVEARTITLMAPSKTYNIAGLECSVAIVPDPELRKRFLAGRCNLVPSVNVMGFAAAQAAYAHGDEWLSALLLYLEANRDYLCAYADAYLPGIRICPPEGTFLAWLDCREAGLPADPYTFFLERARVALNPGPSFGAGGEGFVRLNFGCPRAVLTEALERMRAALAKL